MSGDLHYKLIVDLEQRGSLAPHLEKVGKAGGDLSKVKDTLGSIQSGLGSVASGLAGAFTGAVEAVGSIAVGLAKVGAVGAGAALAYGVGHLNNELEKAQVSLATIFSVQGQSNGMVAGMKDASAVMKDMRKDAADLPGEFKDLMGFFRMAATPGFQAGGDIKRLEKLSANAMATSAAQQIPMDQAARELAMLLQGRAGAHNVFGSLLGFSGEKAQTFNASKPAERLKSVEKELGKYEESRNIFAGTFDAMSGTLIDNGKKFLGAATSGVFDRVKGALESSNRWFDRNEDRVLGFADKIGFKLSYAFEEGQRRIVDWGPPVVAFAEGAYQRISSIWTRVAPLVERVGEVMKKTLSDPGTFGRIEQVLKLYAATKVGMAAAPLASSMMSGMSGMVGSEGLVGAFGGVASLGISAGVGAAALAALGLGAYGAVDILTDASNAWHAGAIESVNDIKANFGRLAEAGRAATPAVRSIADAYGAFLLGGMAFWSGVLATGAEDIRSHMGPLSDAFGALRVMLGKVTAPIENAGAPGGYDGPDVSDAFFSLKKINENGDRDDQKAKTKPVHGGGGTTIQKVEIVVSTNADPSRVARAAVDRLADLSRNPTSSRMVRNWSAVRP